MAALAAPRRALAPVARRLGMRSAPPGARRWWDVVLGEVLAHHLLSEVVVFWYENVHGAVTFAVLGWLWWRRPDILPPLRTAVLITTVVALTAFWSWPVAPPRMLTTDGYVDLVAAVHHLPVWQGGAVALEANQLAALPSLHIAWAVWAAVALWRLSSRRWLRRLAVAYPLVTAFAVMATGNHYLADAVLGAAITALAVLGADRLWASRRRLAPPSDRRYNLVDGRLPTADQGGR
jgi:membrane-associated phospholipid phosphatase